MDTVETLNSIADAIALVCHKKAKRKATEKRTSEPEDHLPRLRQNSAGIWAHPDAKRGYSFPFGLWFRGQSNIEWPLQPAAFRPVSRISKKIKQELYRHEASTHLHWRLLAADQRAHHRSDFEWLALMQHYSLPTRLLDWSENPLVGLYFAVGGNYPGKGNRDANAKKDGVLYVLNARRLNHITSICDYDADSIHIPSSMDAIMRATLASQSRRMRWLDHLEQLALATADVEDPRLLRRYVRLLRRSTSFDVVLGRGVQRRTRGATLSPDDELLAQRVWEQLRCPAAIFPHRMNPRLIAQQGMFTLHGGKPRKTGDLDAPDPHDTPISLESVNSGDLHDQELRKRREQAGCIFRKYRIPQKRKGTILRDLVSLGVHEATLFPGLDGQSMYMSEQWCLEEQMTPALSAGPTTPSAQRLMPTR